MVIGIVGGIASGKSTVADMCRRLGAEVIHADHIGHEVLAEPETVQKLQERWGARILDGQGNPDRASIASIVFEPSPEGREALRFLESVTHPRIAMRIRERIDQLTRAGAKTIVLDAPILLEAGWGAFCDRTLYVDVEREERWRRAERRGWTSAQFSAREASQLSPAEKRKVADMVIDNSASFDHTFAQLQQFWRSLHSLPPSEAC